jgi:cell division protease FtsH
VDEEVRRIIDESYVAALEQLRANRHRLEALTQALLEQETLDEADAYRVAGIPRRPPPDEPVVVAAADQALPRSP